MVWSTEPDAVDFGCRDHFCDRGKRSCIPDAQLAGEGCSFFSMCLVGTVDAENVSVAHAAPCLEMEFGYEPTPDEPYAQFTSSHLERRPPLRTVFPIMRYHRL